MNDNWRVTLKVRTRQGIMQIAYKGEGIKISKILRTRYVPVCIL